MNTPLLVKNLGLSDYERVWRDMQNFTATRTENTADELWLVQHPPVYTLGLNAAHSPLISPSTIPVVVSDRGGQVTYHGPGQLIAYVLLDCRRRGLGIKSLVTHLEQAVINLLKNHQILGERRAKAPGVYVANQKIAALGLRVKKGACYHGISLNVAMDLTPFNNIDPCGFPGLEVTQLSQWVVCDLDSIQHELVEQLQTEFQT